ncbi:hypothetical protein IE53DRAFT_403918 [Violaceomyces palustris]|uniref:Uncharacterized protein n=1 Tax=Violaceomyces palustris TaxID=1673888 RepID=A0ACD0P2N8_9BASI|nr:hypothetical protein IE53DRAFT_403918 [Violaceomyces palustris]
MFAAKNPYEDIVQSATSDQLTSENWELNLEICDRVSNEGETGARNCIAAVQKRLVHRNANVQLYALTLSDTLSKNCGLPVHQEIASRSFTQTLSRISLDRNTHPTVKKRSLSLIKQWAAEFDDESLGIMKETFESLKKQSESIRTPCEEAAKEEPSSEQLRAEDEELRRVLELSMKDQGGRTGWVSSYPGETQGSSSSSAVPAPSSSSAPEASASSSAPVDPAPPVAQASSSTAAASLKSDEPSQPVQNPAPASSSSAPAPSASRVRALYDFTPTEPGELAFSKGDIIRVLDSVYEHWWRGEVRGEAGIFPVNYVEVLPDPSPADLQKEAELEARIFAQASNIDKLLSKLRSLDATRDNLAEDEELQELYQTSLSMRPKIVRLIDRYSGKIAELKAMNDKFIRARGTFDEMMEQSLAKYNPGVPTQDYTQARPEYVNQQAPQDYAQGWDAYYASQGYPRQQGGPPQAAQSSADAYAQWYYSQQQQQQQPQQPQPQPAPAISLQPSANPVAPPSTSTQAEAVHPSQVHPNGAGAPPQDDEKRRLYEQARAQAEAYQQHFHSVPTAGQPSYSQHHSG